LFLKCRLFSQLTPLILSPFIGLGSCNNLNFASFHYFNNFDQSFSNHGSWVVPRKIQEWQFLSALKINLLNDRGVLHWSSPIWDLYTKLFFSAPFGSISGMHFLIYFLAVMTLVAEPLPVTQKASLSAKFVGSGIEKTLHGAKRGEQGGCSIKRISFFFQNCLTDAAVLADALHHFSPNLFHFETDG
jgi:hypothetical protein